MISDSPISRFISTDSNLSPTLDLRIGAHSHIFQPPKTPSASGSLYRSTSSIASGYGSGKCTTSRKRSRHDSYTVDRAATYAPGENLWSPCPSGQSSILLTPGLMSPAPLVNTQYILAAGFDTPTAIRASNLERNQNDAVSPDHVFRGRRGWDEGSCIGSDSYFPQQSCPLGREVNGRPRISIRQPPHEGWAKAVQSVVGVAGRLWNFCTMNAFHGFYAGGGQGYQMNAPKPSFSIQQDTSKNFGNEEKFCRPQRELSSIPGYFPDEDFIPEYMSQARTSPERPAKKIRHEKGAGDLHANWVMIENSPLSRESTPTRASARKVPVANSSRWRALSKGGKRPILSASRPSFTSCAGSPGLRPDRPASYASSRSPLNTPKNESPVSIEAQKHAARMRRREMEDDAHLKRLNQQLKVMIKEGKEALGTQNCGGRWSRRFDG